MTTKALVSEEEYLHTAFEGPEPDYLAGVLMERSMPNSWHSRTHRNLFQALLPQYESGRLFPHSELRLRVAPGRYRVADLCAFTSDPEDAIPEEPPCLVIEIVSPDDRHHELVEKLGEYEAAGVEFIYVADPVFRQLSRYSHRSLIAVDALELPVVGLRVSSAVIFAGARPNPHA